MCNFEIAQLPYLFDGDLKFTESKAVSSNSNTAVINLLYNIAMQILHYIARKHDLCKFKEASNLFRYIVDV